MDPTNLVHFGSGVVDAPGLIRRKTVASVVKAAAAGAIGALVVDARSADDFFRAQALLRALYDDPRNPRRVLHPGRVIALVATGDVEAAFTLGRYGIAGVLEQRALGELEPRLRRILESAPRRGSADDARARAAALDAPRARGPRLQLPTVAIGYRHAPETLAALARYVRVLREQADASTVFADVATLIDVMVGEGLTCQTNLAAKAGATHTGQFIGSFEFYRELRRTRYGRIPDHPARRDRHGRVHRRRRGAARGPAPPVPRERAARRARAAEHAARRGAEPDLVAGGRAQPGVPRMARRPRHPGDQRRLHAVGEQPGEPPVLDDRNRVRSVRRLSVGPVRARPTARTRPATSASAPISTR